ncbi:unnamed protein product, partial [Dovyalis caffra]
TVDTSLQKGLKSKSSAVFTPHGYTCRLFEGCGCTAGPGYIIEPHILLQGAPQGLIIKK